MSSDFTTGKNKSISKEGLYLKLCDTLSQKLNIPREKLYSFYAENGLCSGGVSWDYFDRYNKEFDSNTYSENAFDDLVILSAAVDKDEFLDKTNETVESRRSSILNQCSGMMNSHLCNRFSLTGLFPHLDRPDEIISIDGISGVIPCYLNGYETLYANITYSDSCGCNIPEPVPSYPIGYEGNILVKNSMDETYEAETASYHWEITENPENIVLHEETSGMTSNHLILATSTDAVIPEIKVSLTYEE